MHSTSLLKYFYVVLLSLLISLYVTGCISSGTEEPKSSLDPDTANTVTTKGTTPTGPLASISGTVSSWGSNSPFLSSPLKSFLNFFDLSLTQNSEPFAPACTSGTYSVWLVGGEGTSIASGSFSGGVFKVDNIPVQQEIILTFFCQDGASQRCLGKSGDQGLLCNTVADAVLRAFESAIGKNITNPIFSGKPISKVAASIVEAAQNDSTATDIFKTEIEECRKILADTTACFKNVINASIFAGTFKLMQNMTQTWSVESIFTLVADTLGFEIDADGIIYSDFGTKMDVWLNTDFVAQTRQFIHNVVEDQLTGTGDSYVIKLECQMRYSKYHAGGMLKFSPVLITIEGVSQPSCKNTNALALNGFTEAQQNLIFSAMDSDTHSQVQIGSVACDFQNGWESAGYYCVDPPRLSIVSKFKEPNRNDPDGTRLGERHHHFVSMINIFPELETDFQALLRSDFNTLNQCATMTVDGPPVVDDSETCQSWFKNWMLTQRQNFAGLIGIYMYLKNPPNALTATPYLSLGDLHKIFTKSNFLNTRLASRMPGISGRQYSNARKRHWIPAVLAFNDGNYRIQDIFKWNFNFPTNTAAGDDLLDAAFAASGLPYEDTFKMFEAIPTSDKIHDYVFGSAHHEEWNPYGSKFFHGASIGTTQKPIFCRMTNKITGVVMEQELNENTRIDCLNEAQLSVQGVHSPVDDNGAIYLPQGFAYPYVLQERGWMGDWRGRVYALINRKNGQIVRPGNKDVLIEQLHSGNPDGECKLTSEIGSIVNAKLRYGWGNETKEEAVAAYCLDMRSFTISNQISFYWGGNIEITEKDGAGNSWKWNVRQVGRINTASAINHTAISPVCYFAPSGNFNFDPQTKLASSGDTDIVNQGATIESDGKISDLGHGTKKAILAPCSQTVENTTKYYVTQMWRSWGTSKSDLRAYLIEASGNSRTLQFQTWGQNVFYWEDQFVYLKTDTIETSLDTNNPGSTNLVAPNTAPTYTQMVKLLNQKHDPKFDPYCDDLNRNGKCDCFAKGTATQKNPDQCTLEDIAAEPTLSSPPYYIGNHNTQQYINLFERLGGKSGENLHYTDESHTVEFNWNFMNTNQLWLNSDDAFLCAHKVLGEPSYRKPKYIQWDGFWKNHDGCPKADGSLIALDWNNQSETGGPIRLINPKPMKNAYDIEKPNTLIKLINFATKTVGQGVSVKMTDKLFSFDEALALIALRYQMPPNHIQILDGQSEARGAYPAFESVRLGENHNDAISAILRGITRPQELLLQRH